MKTLRSLRRCCLAEMLVLLALFATPARADQEGDFIFARNGATARLTGYVGPGGVVVIPDRLGNLPVASIGNYAFFARYGLTSVTIPNSVTNIGEEAFLLCTHLTSVTFPNNVANIGDGAFYACTNLTNVTIPNSVTNIGWQAFSECTGLTAIEVDSLNVAYSSAEGVLFNKTQSVLIQYPVVKAGPYTIPNSVTNLGNGAFENCTALTSVTIPNSVTSIGGQTFYGCALLTSVAIPDSVTFIGAAAFSGCTSLTCVTIPNRVTFIRLMTFGGCTSLTSVYFEGDAPGASARVGLGDFVTVFYRAGAAGWTPTFAGRPTAVWMPRPAYADWAVSTGLTTHFPNASAQGDDPDGDGLTNGDEWFAATDPTQPASRLELELTPRTADLSASDQTPIEPNQHAVYFRSVPDRYYGVQRATSLDGAWELQATKVAATTQTRFVLPKPVNHAFYRVLALP